MSTRANGSIEVRSAALEIRAADRRLYGVAAVYGVTANIGSFQERIAPGAFDRTLVSGRDVVALADHNPAALLGRTRAGSLRLASDGEGLRFEIDLPGTTLASDMLALVESRNAGGMSFGFRVAEGGETWKGNLRTLTDVDLLEVSVVSSFPAYEGTSIAARAQMTPATRLRRARMFMETL